MLYEVHSNVQTMIVRELDVIGAGIYPVIVMEKTSVTLNGRTPVFPLRADRHTVAGMIYPSAVDLEAFAELVRGSDVELVAVVVAVPVPAVTELGEETLRPRQRVSHVHGGLFVLPAEGYLSTVGASPTFAES